MIIPDFEAIDGFEWDTGNVDKNYDKHKVTSIVCEEVFSNEPLLLFPDELHSSKEDRYTAFGKTNHLRFLVTTFMIRKNKIRIISARDMTGKEKKLYENA